MRNEMRDEMRSGMRSGVKLREYYREICSCGFQMAVSSIFYTVQYFKYER